MRLLNERYEVIRVLGSGGGAVYKALDHQLDRVVALKIRTTDGQALASQQSRAAGGLQQKTPQSLTCRDNCYVPN